MATKYKYMPLSEANVSPVMAAAYDGQHIYVHGSAHANALASPVAGVGYGASYGDNSYGHGHGHGAAPRVVRYAMGNYLGGGIAGVVYEAYDKLQQRQVAIKILNPVGYKLSPPSALRRGEIIKKGVPLVVQGGMGGTGAGPVAQEHVFWVKLPTKRELVACYAPASSSSAMMVEVAPHMLRELTLEMCVALWSLEADEQEDEEEEEEDMEEEDMEEYDEDDDDEDDEDYEDDEEAMEYDDDDDDDDEELDGDDEDGEEEAQRTAHRRGDDGEDFVMDEEFKCSGSCGHEDDDEDEEMMMLRMMHDDACVQPQQDRELALAHHGHRHRHRQQQQQQRRRRRHRRLAARFVKVGDVVYKLPRVPAKFLSFLASRKTIYREIAHMHKLTGNSISGPIGGGGHANVLKLYDVLELVQASKSTIFLVLELAAGGELFDRIRADQGGVDEPTARGYVTQLLAGVLFCHQLGIVHRDLKPENLLLSDADVLKIADFGLSAHFIAAVSSGGVATGASSSSASQTTTSLATAPSPLLMACSDIPSSSARGLHPVMDNEDMDVHVARSVLSSTSSASSSSSNGLAMLPPAQFRRLNSIVGSPHYVAPEVMQNARYGYDGRKADMWSIGVIVYGLLVGSLPFGKDLPTCPRYLKFCEWIRSLPCDPQTGKLLYDADVYRAGGVAARHTRTTTAATTIPHHLPHQQPTDEEENDPQAPSRFAQVYPNLTCRPPSPSPLPKRGNVSGTPWWLHATASSATAPIKPCSYNDTINTNTTHALLANGAPAGRRGSRVVSFPSWLFPPKLSPSATFLLATLLHPEPGKRFACEDACRCAWVTDTGL